MTTVPTPSAEEAEANAAFAALLWAMSRPGEQKTLPAAGMLSLMNALIDRECLAYSSNTQFALELQQRGAELCNLDQADFVFFDKLYSTELLGQVRTGSDLYPDDGATVVLCAEIGTGPEYRLSGPGIEGSISIQLAALPDGFWRQRETMIQYPSGFDLFIVDHTSLLGVPRSTTVKLH